MGVFWGFVLCGRYVADICIKGIYMSFWKGLLNRKAPISDPVDVDVIVSDAYKLLAAINTSLKAANESSNPEVKRSELDYARNSLSAIVELSSQHSFIKLDSLKEVEISIAGVEADYQKLKGKPVQGVTVNVGADRSFKLSENQSGRKGELVRLSEDIGSTNAACPYCSIQLPKFPMRKTKCKSCGGRMYSRKEPLSAEKRIFREDELAVFDEIKRLADGVWDSWNKGVQELKEVKDELAAEWGSSPDSISDGDAQWRVSSRKLQDAMMDGDWGLYVDLKFDSIVQLNSEGKIDACLAAIPECIYLSYTDVMEPNSLSLFSAGWDVNELELNTVYLSHFNSIAKPAEIKKALYSSKVVERYVEVYGLSIDEAWAKFTRDRGKYLRTLKNRNLK